MENVSCPLESRPCEFVDVISYVNLHHQVFMVFAFLLPYCMLETSTFWLSFSHGYCRSRKSSKQDFVHVYSLSWFHQRLLFCFYLFSYVLQVQVADPFMNPSVRSLYEEWLGQPGSEKAKKHIHTEYHPVVKSITSQLHNW